MTEVSSNIAKPEVFHAPGNTMRIEGNDVEVDDLDALLSDDSDKRQYVRHILGADGEQKPMLLKSTGKLNGQPVEIVQGVDGQFRLLPVAESSNTVSESLGETQEIPTKPQKKGGQVLRALRIGFGIRHKEESHGVDPDAVQAMRGITYVDMSGANNHVRRTILPDHLSSNR